MYNFKSKTILLDIIISLDLLVVKVNNLLLPKI